MKIEIEKLEVGERLREVKSVVVAAIASSFRTEGQLQPIVVRTDGGRIRLVAGAHRVEAAKLCGWKYLTGEPLKLDGLSPKMVELTVAIAEVDENLTRRELDSAERPLFVDERVRLTADRIALNKLQVETAAHTVADTRKDKNHANDRKKRAEKSAAKVSVLSGAGATQTAGRLPNDVLEVVSLETGLAKDTIRKSRWVVEKVGRENLKIMAGTNIATKAEINGFIALKKEDPKAADKCMKDAANAKSRGIGAKRQEGDGTPMGFAPSDILGAIKKQQNVDARFEATKSDEGRLQVLFDVLQEVEGKLRTHRTYFAKLSPDNAHKMKAWPELVERTEALRRMARELIKPDTAKQKRVGNEEHRYPDELPKESKDEVRKSLGKLRVVK